MKDGMLWTFNHRRGPVLTTGAVVRARSEEMAMAVAMRWCADNSARFCGKVFPFIVADESILGLDEPMGEVSDERRGPGRPRKAE